MVRVTRLVSISTSPAQRLMMKMETSAPVLTGLQASTGDIASGATINTSALSAGVHTITAEAEDSGDPTTTPKTGNDQITITVNRPPTVTITAPSTGSHSTQGDNVNFIATATDPEDGNIGASINWNSSIDGCHWQWRKHQYHDPERRSPHDYRGCQ